jgi:glutamate dehydrogenase (NAD(P)+)
MKDMRDKEKLSDLSDRKCSYNISDKDTIFEVKADVFIPAAMTGVINDSTAPKILEQEIKVIIEAANIPTTSSADSYLRLGHNSIFLIFILNIVSASPKHVFY